MSRLNSKKASIFLMSMFFVSSIFVVLVSIMLMQLRFHKMNKKNLHRTIALYNAESGIQLALHELKHKDSTTRWVDNGWTINGNIYTIVKDGITYPVIVDGLTP